MKLEKFAEKNNKKTSIIIFTICCILLIVGVFFYQTFALFETKENFNFIEGNIDNPGDLYFAYYKDDQITLDVPNKESGYILSNKSNCTNGVTISWDEESWSAVLNYSNYQKENNSGVKCTLYFENKYKNLMIPMEYSQSTNGSGSIGYLINKTYVRNYDGTHHDNGLLTLTKVIYQKEKNPIDNAIEIVDFSVAQDRSILGYYVKEENSNTKINLYIQAEGKIKVNQKAAYYGLLSSECSASGCTSYVSSDDHGIIGIENWDLSEVTDASYMFAWSLNENFSLNGYDLSKVTNMSYMFNQSSIKQIDFSGINTENVTNMDSMFFSASNLTNITYGDNFIHKEGANITDMFNGCPANKPTHSSWNGVF